MRQLVAMPDTLVPPLHPWGYLAMLASLWFLGFMGQLHYCLSFPLARIADVMGVVLGEELNTSARGSLHPQRFVKKTNSPHQLLSSQGKWVGLSVSIASTMWPETLSMHRKCLSGALVNVCLDKSGEMEKWKREHISWTI